MNSFFPPIGGMSLIWILYCMAQTPNNPYEPLSYPIMRFFAWLFSIIGILWLFSYLWFIISADTSADIMTFNPAIFVLFGLSAYLFNYQGTKLPLSKRVNRVIYIFSLILSFMSMWHSEIVSFSGIIFGILMIYGLDNYCEQYSKKIRYMQWLQGKLLNNSSHKRKSSD